MSKFINFRVSEWEYRKLKAKAKEMGLTLSDFIKQKLKNETPLTIINLNEILTRLDYNLTLLQWALKEIDNFVCECVRVSLQYDIKEKEKEKETYDIETIA